MSDNLNNSNMKKAKDEVKAVVADTNTVSTKKKSELSKIKDHLIQDELPKTRNHIIYDILIPKTKQIILDSFAALLGGSYSNNPTQQRNNNPNRVQYNRYSKVETVPASRVTRPIGFDYDPIEYQNRVDAQAVLDSMIDIIHERGTVSVSQMYALSNIEECPYTYENHGWMLNTPNDLNGAYVKQDMYSGNYVLILNKPIQIK